ncbi:hypothetical protein [Rhodococcus koreensis]|uniref:Uncharacterized protein n=1 Tax=Rhodococcus koreensis TaxID=99653 RepID=A0A1H4S0C0_9NOCA|nr:hypothetical protein [Rhodococcus koreensis]QSE82735.1 hypothetical protein JWS14_28035 [Rhodococcus koreensis]SEC37610.1 hypothetical protein SAMN04490239_3862 [Rhodococcus koreensis]
MTFRISHVCLLLGGFVAGIALTSTGSGGFVFVVGREVLDASYLDPAAGATLAAVVAVLVTVLVRARRGLSALSFAGLALLGVARSIGPWDFEMFLGGVAAGLLLGGLVGLCATADLEWLQTALAAGVLTGVLLDGPIEHLRISLPRRYADYLPGHTVDAAALAVLALTAVVLAVALWSGDFGERADLAVSRRAVVAGIVVPLVGLVLCWWFVHQAWDVDSDGGMQGRWVFGIVLVAVVIAAALWLEGRTGIVLLAAMALVATGGIGRSAFPDSWPWLLLPAALSLAGAVLGRRFPQPVLGIAALAVVAASAVFEHPPWDNLQLGAMWLLLPLAATYTFASSVPSSGPVTAAALAIPAALTVPLVVDYGWTAYTPLTTSGTTPWPDSWGWTSTGVSVAAVVAYGLTAAYLGKRPS